MWRTTSELNRQEYPTIAAEYWEGWKVREATAERAHWEAGYTAGLANCEAELTLHDVSRIMLNGRYGKAVQQREYWQRQAEKLIVANTQLATAITDLLVNDCQCEQCINGRAVLARFNPTQEQP